MNNLPVRVIRFEPGKKQQVLLETNSLVPIFIPANTFELPKNYKEAKEEQEVTNVDDGNLKGLIDNWTGGEKFK